MAAFATSVSRIALAVVCAIPCGVAAASPDRAQPVTIEHACLTTYPKAECTKIHLYLKNLSPYPVLVEGVYLGDRFLDLNPEHLGRGDFSGVGWSEEAADPLSAPVSVHGHDRSAPASASERADSAVQWVRALPNPIEPMGIGGVTISLWGTVKAVPIRISLRGAGELRWEAKEEKSSLRLSHVAFDPANPNRIYVYCENKADRDIVVDHILINTERVETFTSIPSGNAIKAGKKSCFIIRPKQRMVWGKYVGIGVAGKGGEEAVAVVRVINYFPIGSWSVDTRTEMFFDSIDLHRPMPDMGTTGDTAERFEELLETMPLETVGGPYQACYDGRDPTCDQAGWQKNAERIILAMDRLNDGRSPIPYYTHLCSPFEREYAFFGELPDLTLINPYTILYRAVSPWESGARLEQARTWADPRPVVAVSEAFCEGVGERDLSPDEVSFALWNEIAAGAKGVRYFTRNGGASAKGYAQLPGVEARMARDDLNLQLLKGFLRIGDPFPLAWGSSGDLSCRAVLCGEEGIVLFLFNKGFTGGKKSMSLWTPQDSSRFGAEIPKGLAVNRVFHVDAGFREVPFSRAAGAVEFDLPSINTVGVFFLSSGTGNAAPRPSPAASAAHQIGLPGADRLDPGGIAAQYKARAQELAAPLLNPAAPMERKALIDLAQRLRLEKDSALRALHEFDGAVPSRGADGAQKLFDLASAYMDLGLDEDAFALCRRFSKGLEAEVAVTTCKKLSMRALATGNYRLAIQCLEFASHLADDREVRNGLLTQLAEVSDGTLRRPEDTLKWIEVILSEAGGNRGEVSRLRARAALLCLKANRVDEAIRHLETIDRAEWAIWNVDYNLGCAFAKKAEAGKAIEHFRSSVIHREPQADQAQFLIGWLLLTGGKRSEAVVEFRRLEERFPTSACVLKARELTAGRQSPTGEAAAWHMASDRQ